MAERAADEPTLAIHGTALSGHTHRVESLVVMLGLPYHFVDSPVAVRQTPEFRALNPLAQIPVLVDGDLVLCDSNAILVYLAKRYDREGRWLPEDPVGAARVQRWLAIAAGEVRHGPSEARLITLFGRPGDIVAAHAIAAGLLRFMDGHLAGRNFLAAENATIADLACYAYVAHAPEGGVALEPYPAVRAWIGRVEALPGFKRMKASAIPPAAARRT